jgi:hypothetical protein
MLALVLLRATREKLPPGTWDRMEEATTESPTNEMVRGYARSASMSSARCSARGVQIECTVRAALVELSDSIERTARRRIPGVPKHKVDAIQ